VLICGPASRWEPCKQAAVPFSIGGHYASSDYFGNKMANRPPIVEAEIVPERMKSPNERRKWVAENKNEWLFGCGGRLSKCEKTHGHISMCQYQRASRYKSP
jgi:hypothetical protein